METNLISQSAFDRLLRGQNAGDGPGDIASLDLSSLSFAVTELSGTTIAMSRFPPTQFDNSFDLGGVTWIGNDLHDCTFVDVNMNKAELLDCVLTRCSLQSVSLFRTDLTGTVFDRCTLENLDLSSNVCLMRVTMKQCTFSNVRVSGSMTINGVRDLRFDKTGRMID